MLDKSHLAKNYGVECQAIGKQIYLNSDEQLRAKFVARLSFACVRKLSTQLHVMVELVFFWRLCRSSTKPCRS